MSPHDHHASPHTDTRLRELPFVPLTRRGLFGAAAGAMAVMGLGPEAVAVPIGKGRATFLSKKQLATLAGVVDRVVPGQPEDTVAGAVAARVHEGIDSLLAAFETDPPRIYAGGPFSKRGGSPTNDFAEFLTLDRYESTAWKLRLYGSRGKKRLERNGPVIGLRQIYREGLTALEKSTPGFASLPGPARELALRTAQDPAVATMMGYLVNHTYEFMYGAPEYGGNARETGWKGIGFDGDVQPRGYTHKEVTHPESTLLPILDAPLADLIGVHPVLPLAVSDTAMGLLAAAGGNHTQLARDLDDLLGGLSDPESPQAKDLAELRTRSQALVAQARRRQTGQTDGGQA